MTKLLALSFTGRFLTLEQLTCQVMCKVHAHNFATDWGSVLETGAKKFKGKQFFLKKSLFFIFRKNKRMEGKSEKEVEILFFFIILKGWSHTCNLQ